MMTLSSRPPVAVTPINPINPEKRAAAAERDGRSSGGTEATTFGIYRCMRFFFPPTWTWEDVAAAAAVVLSEGRARPQEPPACQADLCSQMQPREGRGGGGRGGDVRRSPESKDSRAKRVEEDLSEERRRGWGSRGEGGRRQRVLVTLQQP
ncbi:hypothetical protein EYF80_027082 [Liparis tanakae]|uniref:Uncharacterized protein n=1 Tax=Liparis tanakae TaxID=230148 RepID=A0A4Z2HB39_9TELE|nr:hypothetical protein EYF80_027082 [Liparis tanakae]